MIFTKTHGNLNNTTSFLDRLLVGSQYNNIERLAQLGVEALAAATPRDTGLTSNSWGYRVFRSKGKVSIIWHNSNTNKGAIIALLIQYGHGTGTGGYVQGTDYINPAIRPIFDTILDNVWEEVMR